MRISVEVPNTTGLFAKDVFIGPNSWSVPIPVTSPGTLRATSRTRTRLVKGRIETTLVCPASGTQNCRVGVAARLRPGGRGPSTIGATAATVVRGTSRKVRIRVPKAIMAKVRRKPKTAILTATRTDVPSGPLRTSETVRLTVR